MQKYDFELATTAEWEVRKDIFTKQVGFNARVKRRDLKLERLDVLVIVTVRVFMKDGLLPKAE